MPLRSAPPRTRLRSATRVIGIIELTFGSLALLVILVLVFLQALQRYLPFEHLAWTGELARFSLVWLTFSALGVLVTSRGHISLEILDSLKNQTALKIVHVVSAILLAAVGAGLSVAAWNLVVSQGIITSPVLRLPMSLFYVPVLIGLASLTIRAIVLAIDVAISGPVLTEVEDDDVAPEGVTQS